MSDIQTAIRQQARKLLESGEVVAFIGWEEGRFGIQTTPLVCFSPDDTDRLIFNEYCANNLAKYVMDLKDRGRVGLCVRGCDARAINRMIQDRQFKREDVVLLGIPCPQMKDRNTGNVLEKCRCCQHRNPVIYDELLGEQVDETGDGDRYGVVAQIERMTREERQNFFDMAYSKCIRCNACRNVCPCCTCRTCFVDQREVGWQGKQNNLTENRFFGLVRAYHVADRCIECGECERVCPMDLPLMALTRKMVKDMNGLFGEYESGVSSDRSDVLTSYRLDDIEEFM